MGVVLSTLAYLGNQEEGPLRMPDLEAKSKLTQRQKLDTLVKGNHAHYSVFYGPHNFHNHTPHLLASLFKFGASNDLLAHAYEVSSEDLTHWEQDPIEITEFDWKDYLGKVKYQASFKNFFDDEISNARFDWEKIVSKFIISNDELLVSLFFGLGHPLIHLAYAYELDSQHIASEAMVLDMCSYNSYVPKILEYITNSLPLNQSSDTTTHTSTHLSENSKSDLNSNLNSHTDSIPIKPTNAKISNDPFDIIDQFLKDESVITFMKNNLPVTNDKNNNNDNTSPYYKNSPIVLENIDKFIPYVDCFDVSSENNSNSINSDINNMDTIHLDNKALKNLTYFAVYLFSSTKRNKKNEYSFFLLHAVTVIFALHTVIKQLPTVYKQQILLKTYWFFTMFIFIIFSFPKIDKDIIENYEIDSDLDNWDKIIAKVLGSEFNTDAHFVKVVRALKEFEGMYPEEKNEGNIFLKAAAKFVKEFNSYSYGISS